MYWDYIYIYIYESFEVLCISLYTLSWNHVWINIVLNISSFSNNSNIYQKLNYQATFPSVFPILLIDIYFPKPPLHPIISAFFDLYVFFPCLFNSIVSLAYIKTCLKKVCVRSSLIT